MAKEGGFFSPNRKVSGKDKQVASSMSSGSYGGYIDAGERRGFVSPEQAESMLANPERFKMRPSETRYLRESMGLPRAQFFNPSGNEVGQIASATSDLSGLIAQDTNEQKYTKEGFNQYMNKFYGFGTEDRKYKNYPGYFKQTLQDSYKDDVDSGYFKEGQFVNQLPKNYGEQEQKIIQDNQFNKYLKDEFGTDDLNYGDKQFFRDAFDEGDPYKRMPFNKDQSLKAPKENIFQKVGSFLTNTFTGSQPVAAGTLDANQQVSQVSERPKLSYVNPDATRMSFSEVKEAFKPSNLFGYKDKFGRFDDPGSPLSTDRAQTIQRVAQNFSSPIVGDARTIGQIRADQEARMRENARLRNESFQRGEQVKQKSADVTYGTNMLSNPAFGFRDKMTDVAKAQYDRSARDATEMARTDPSLGNVITSGVNFLKGQINKITGETALTREKSLEKIGERQLRLANKEINRPSYQKEAYARKFLGITNDQLKARSLQQIRANATARNQAFQADRRARAVEKAARRYGQNTGSGRTGGFGSGTTGQGMSSNPAGMRQQGVGVSANNLSRHTVGHSSTQPGSKSGGKKGGGKKGGGGGGGGQTGGTTGRKGMNRSKSRRRCDIRTKIDINQLTNQNLMKDDLATVAYFLIELSDN